MFLIDLISDLLAIKCSEKFITINQGDSIHHPHHGIGKITSIREQSFSGDANARFANIFFKRDSLTLIVRESELEAIIRKPMSLKEANKLLDHLQSWKGTVSEQWKPRATAHQVKMDSGEPLHYAEVYKNLRVRQEEGTLSAADRKHLSQSGELLAEELANALGKTPSEALKQISLAAQ